MAHDAAAIGEPGTTDAVARYAPADLGRWAATYALAMIFLTFGASKFTPAAGMELTPLIMNSPLVAWWHGLFGVDGTARVLGVYEILTGVMLAARAFNPRLAAIGAAMAGIAFLVTLSFLFTTPGIAAGAGPFPLTMLGQFLLKDLVLLCAAWVIFDAARAGAAIMPKRAREKAGAPA